MLRFNEEPDFDFNDDDDDFDIELVMCNVQVHFADGTALNVDDVIDYDLDYNGLVELKTVSDETHMIAIRAIKHIHFVEKDPDLEDHEDEDSMN